jgi:ATP-dependent helicase/nuclease subunit B
MSASRFEDYVKCPLAFFFKRVLKLTPPDDVDTDVSAREHGSITHDVLFEYHARRGHDQPPAERERLILEIADGVLAVGRVEGLYAEVHRDRLHAMLRAYLLAEAGGDRSFRPAYFEARFGPQRDPAGAETVLSEQPLPLDVVTAGGREYQIALSGSIDRVDLRERDGVIEARIIDYKTGKIRDEKLAEARTGLALQLTLYSHVLPALIANHELVRGRPVRVVDASYYEICDPREVELKPVQNKNATVAALTAGAVTRAVEVVRAALEGRFHATADDDPCRYCDYRASCRGYGDDVRIGAVPDARRFVQKRSLA